MKRKTLDILIIINWISLIILTIVVKYVDVKVYEETFSKIGLFSINKLFLFNVDSNIFKIVSDLIFIFCLFIMLNIVFYNLIRTLKNKKMNKCFASFMIYIIIMLMIWIIFDKIIIVNYRPILVDGFKEGSYPSTHVMVCCYIFLCCTHFIKINLKNNKFLCILFLLLILAISFTRLLSKMHWFTDIISGLLVGNLLFLLFIRSNYGYQNSLQQ